MRVVSIVTMAVVVGMSVLLRGLLWFCHGERCGDKL
jgi:hypothetical protein